MCDHCAEKDARIETLEEMVKATTAQRGDDFEDGRQFGLSQAISAVYLVTKTKAGVKVGEG